MQQSSKNVELIAPGVFTITLPISLLLKNVIIFQGIFHLSIATLNTVAQKQNLFNFDSLLTFALDMWLIALLYCAGCFVFSIFKKQKELLLASFLILPTLIILFSLLRDVPSLIVIALVSVISFFIYRFNYEKLSCQYLEDIAARGFK